MGFRFGKSISLGKGFRLNISKSGIGMSAGIKGFRGGIGPRGTRLTASIPGTGISYVSQSKKSSKRRSVHSKNERFYQPQLQAVPPVQIPKSPVEIEFLEGINQYQLGNLESALPHFYSVSSADAAGYLFTSIILASIPKYEVKAIEWLENLIHFDVSFPTPLMEKYGIENSVIKLGITKNVVASVPLNNLGATLLLVELYQSSQRLNDAIGLLEEIVQINNDTIIYLSLCELYFQQRIYDGVIEIGKRIVVSDDISFEIAIMYGQTLQEKILHEAAIQIFTEALRKKKFLDEKLVCEAMYWRAISYEKIGKTAQSQKEFQKIYALIPDFRDISNKLGIDNIKRFCGNCGIQIKLSSKFCSSCGIGI